MASTTQEPKAPLREATGYRFQHLKTTLVLRDLYYTKRDPKPGDRVVEFDLPTLDGGRFRSGDLAETGPALLIFGSYTCPVTDSSAPRLNELHARFGDRVRFVMVNVREAHPGANASQPVEFEAKREHAERLRALHGIPYEVAMDDIDGTLHRALGPKPNSAYLLGSDGTILFRAHWANDEKRLAQALEAASAGRPLPRTEGAHLIGAMWPTVRYIAPTLERAGRSAWRDMWLAVPPWPPWPMCCDCWG